MTGSCLSQQIVRFGQLLREAGFAAGPAEAIDALRALRAVGLERRDDVRAALAAVYVRGPEQLDRFAALFEHFWSGRNGLGEAPAVPLNASGDGAAASRRSQQSDPNGDGRAPAREATADPPSLSSSTVTSALSPTTEEPPARRKASVYAPDPALLERDFSTITLDELPGLRPLVERVARRLATRRARRARAARRGERLDPRRSLALTLRHGGDPVRLAFRKRRIRRARLVVLCDVSGSMAVYARFLLAFVHALQQAAGHRVESFVFSTELQRVTPQLRRADLRAAVEAAMRAARDWGGGTRLGRSLEAFYRQYAELLDADTVLIMLSDGLDTGEPDLLQQQMQRLERRVRRIIWLNPLAGDPRYEPLAVGMRTALPYVDVLAPAHNLASLLALERFL